MEAVAIVISFAFFYYGYRRYSDAAEIRRQTHQQISEANIRFASASQQLQTQAASNQSQEQQIEELRQKVQEEKKFVDDFIAAKISQYPVLAKMVAEYHAARDEAIATYLSNKNRPALTAAEHIRKLKEEKEELRTQLVSCSWELESIYSILPAFREIKNVSIENAISTLQAICVNITLQEANKKSNRKIQEANEYYNEKQIAIEAQREAMEKTVKRQHNLPTNTGTRKHEKQRRITMNGSKLRTLIMKIK